MHGKSSLFFLVAIVATGMLHSASSDAVQVGNRFPLGLHLGGSGNCSDVEDEGYLRFHEGAVQVCRGNEWLDVGNNETLNINSDLAELRQRLDDLESSGVQRNNRLISIQMCNYHGLYNDENRECECDCDARLGCWTAIRRCTECADGWTGEFCTIDIEDPSITLLGGSAITVEAGDTVPEPGFSAWDNRDLDITNRVIVSSPFYNENGTYLEDVARTVGVYTVDYSVSDDAGHTVSVQRGVEIIDTTAPTVVLVGPATITLEAAATWNDTLFVDISDNAVGALTVDVSPLNYRSVGTHTLSYTGSDTHGNTAAPIDRTIVIVDTTPPVIILNGESSLEHTVGFTYIDAGATTEDNSDGSVNLQSSSTVQDDTLGNYTVTFTATDAYGNVATPVIRYVEVTDDIMSCNQILSRSGQSSLPNGYYNVSRSGTQYTTYCMFRNGLGYDLLISLLSRDNQVREFGDTAFWESPGSSAIDTSLGIFQQAIKSPMYSYLTDVSRLMFVLADNTVEVGTVEFPILSQYQSLSVREGMASLDDTLYTSSAIASTLTGATDDGFTVSGESITLNGRQTWALSNRARFMPTTTRHTGDSHRFTGVGGYHYTPGSGAWGMHFEYAPKRSYCSLGSYYGDSNTILDGNYRPAGNYLNYPVQSVSQTQSWTGGGSISGVGSGGCTSGTASFPRDIAIFAVGEILSPPVSGDSRVVRCEDYRIGGGTTGRPDAINEPTEFCLIQNSRGYNLLFNLNPNDDVVRDFYDDTFWEGEEGEFGVPSATMGEEVKTVAYSHLRDMEEILVVLHDGNGGTHGFATYETLSFARSMSMREWMATLENTVVTTARTAVSGSISLPTGSEDLFLQNGGALRINAQRNSALQNRARIVRDGLTNNNDAHSFSGVGGFHYTPPSGSWSLYYENAPHTSYCPLAAAYGSSSTHLNGNFRPSSGDNWPSQRRTPTGGWKGGPGSVGDCGHSVSWVNVHISVYGYSP